MSNSNDPRSAAKLPGRPQRRWVVTWKHISTTASLLALVAFGYVAGAAVMFFGFPSAEFMGKAFLGAEAWLTADPSAAPKPPGQVTVDGGSEDTFDGFTLWSKCNEPAAVLIDMRGRVVHQWSLPRTRRWLHAPAVRGPLPGETVHWERCRLFANGDLLALCCKQDGTPYGFGLVKLDKDSNVLWDYAAKVHHDVALGDDDLIYTLTYEFNNDLPPGMEGMTGKYTAEQLVVLSKEGKMLEKLPLLEAFRNSPFYLALLPSPRLDAKMPSLQIPNVPGAAGLPLKRMRGPMPPDPHDIFHANSVQPLSRALAPKFPLFKAGQVLISLRTSSVLAVVDLPSRSVVWAAAGIWFKQHAATFLDNGHLLLFDNSGAKWGARVLEYDPVHQAIPWSYAATEDKPLTSPQRGIAQRLPNGNTLIVESEGSRILEVTKSHKVVWEWILPPAADKDPPEGRPVIGGGQRFGPDELTFLQGTPNGKPR